MRRPLHAALAALLALPALLPAQQVVGRDQDVFNWSDRVERGGLFRFASPTGKVSVTPASGDRVEIRAEKILRDGRAGDIGFVVVQGSDGITVCAVYSDDDECDRDGLHRSSDRGSRNERDRATLDVTIRVPAGVRIAASSGNGDVSVEGATASVTAGSGNGRVRVTGSGAEVRASSGNGDVTVERAAGPVDASSGNGKVTVATARGPVTARSGNGDVSVSMQAVRGDGDVDLSSGNGRVTVTLPADFAADVDASTGGGTIETDFPLQVTGRVSRSRLRGTIGGGGRRLRLRSGNGGIEIRRG